MVLTAALAADAGPTDQVQAPRERPPAVAGQFYPADPVTLRAAVRALLDDALQAGTSRPQAVLAPHAGYVFSGQIAADAFRQAMGHPVDLVVIVGTNHTRAGFDGVSVYQGEGYRTPLGLARIDREVAAALIGGQRRMTFEPAVHLEEHSVEVQIPFVQVAFPGVPIVTAVVGSPDPGLCVSFGRVLADAVRGRSALLVASSDLSHYPAHDDAAASDLAVLRAIASLDAETLSEISRREIRAGRKGLVTCACGEGPIRVVMEAARRLGATHGRIVSYANSGDTLPGNRERVVGYAAVSFEAGDVPADSEPEWQPVPFGEVGDIDAAAGEALAAFARRAIQRYMATETVPLGRNLPAPVSQPRAAFVTLTEGGRLRGCMGGTTPDRPLWQAVGAAALQAAFGDPRFSPLTSEELPHLDLQVSVLGPMVGIRGLREVVLGRDGVLLRRGAKAGLFLPEVATDQGWDHGQLAEALCRKAGLSGDDCLEGSELYTFRTQKF